MPSSFLAPAGVAEFWTAHAHSNVVKTMIKRFANKHFSEQIKRKIIV
jgi:hypothetical protein